MFSTIMEKGSEEAENQSASQEDAGKKPPTPNERGTRLWGMLQHKLRSHKADWSSEATFLNSYEREVKVVDVREIPTPARDVVSKAYECSTAYKCSTRSKGSTVDAYENYIDASKGFIIASYNYAEKDTNKESARLNNSEILWNQWVIVAKKQTCLVSNLKEILRSSIANNDVTGAVLGEIVRVKDILKGGRTLKPDEPEFFTLLGTPNCLGVAYLLTQHSNALKQKTISKIIATKSYIRILLEPWKPADEAASSSTQSSG